MIKKLVMLLTLILSVNINAQQNYDPVVVLELFTSQGCSSCPSADKLLNKIKEKYKKQNVYVLSYHVDYWNRLGWKDPFSSSKYSDYQRKYAKRFDIRSIYTPQLVVNGSEHFTGSNRYKTDSALEKYSKTKASTMIAIKNVRKEGSAISFDYNIKGEQFDNLTLALVVSDRTTNISKGENRSRTLKNTNIVANRLVRKENFGKVSITIADWVREQDELSIIAYTQGKALKITGAIQIML
ncbi:DUF1223 domain-containing protein [Aquimarina sediminis]|uniref:DUF1223 domain-containing protein n=1 Tax=Aquimarina sediminis TaxID=2070536 RepID=UPI0013E8BB16|nr:DUF1223 domain-containing protein [Aquimarina sediminis]